MYSFKGTFDLWANWFSVPFNVGCNRKQNTAGVVIMPRFYAQPT